MKRLVAIAAAAAFLFSATAAFADSLGSAVGGQAGNQSNLAGGLCLTSPVALSNGQQRALLVDCTTGALVVIGAGAGGSTTVIQPTGSLLIATVAQPTASLLNATVTPAQRTLVTLDVKTVTTGGTAVNALSAGHRTAGGFLQNPIGATIALCINEIGAATGTTSAGDTTCIQPGQSYVIAPGAAAVSVISSDSSHPFSGYGMQ